MRNVIFSSESSGRCASSSTYTCTSFVPTLAGSTTRLRVPPWNATVDENTPPVDAASRAGVIATSADVITSTATRPTISPRTVVSSRRHASADLVVFAAPGPPTLAPVVAAGTPSAVTTRLPVRRMSGTSSPVVVRRERADERDDDQLRDERQAVASRGRARAASRLPSTRGYTPVTPTATTVAIAICEKRSTSRAAATASPSPRRCLQARTSSTTPPNQIPAAATCTLSAGITSHSGFVLREWPVSANDTNATARTGDTDPLQAKRPTRPPRRPPRRRSRGWCSIGSRCSRARRSIDQATAARASRSRWRSPPAAGSARADRRHRRPPHPR